MYDLKTNVQGIQTSIDLHVLPLVRSDMILGNAWLKNLGNVITNFETIKMEFKLRGNKQIWMMAL